MSAVARWSLLSFLTIAAMPRCHAAEPQWPSGSYQYVVLDQDLRAVLLEFGVNTGLRMALSDTVQGHVHGRMPGAPAQDFLNGVAKAFGLDWYYDGAVVSVSAVSEAKTKLIPLKGVRFEKVSQELAQAGLLDPRYKFEPGSSAELAVASGPPRFLALVEQAIATLAPDAPRPELPKALILFRGTSSSRVQLPVTGGAS